MRTRWLIGARAMVVATAFQIASSAAAGNLDRPPGAVGDLTLETKNVVIEDGTEVEVEAGHLLVPENRSRQHSPPISIPFYRLRATGERPASPIFLLAGGPGSSWIDRFENEENFAEVQFYRSLADVVLFDQRGGGHSNPTMSCEEQDRLPLDRPLDRRQRAAKLQQMSARCRQHWIDAGVDLTGYTTTENVADVLALRTALGYEKMTLVGGSYGSHLALALMRTAPEAIDRVVLYGVEGVDHTWDDPAGRLAAYERIAGAIETSAELGSDVPEIGLVGILEEVIDRLEQEPVAVSVGDGDQQQQVIVDAELVRLLAGFQAGRFSRPNAWPEFLLDLYGGDYSFLARGAMALRRLELDDPMHYMMDCASGVSAERAERFRRDPARGVLGDVNFEYEELCRAWKAPDLGSEFRSAVVSDVPTLVVHGTWDTSTPIENAREVVSTLSHGHLLEVIGGNHGALYNLFERWPPVYDRLGAFLRGEPVRFPSSVTLPRPKLSPRQGD